MQSFVCMKYRDRYIIANRNKNLGAFVSNEQYAEIKELLAKKVIVSGWLLDLLQHLGGGIYNDREVKDLIFLRNSSNFNFVRASYEVTELCNYRCKHCYLGDKKPDSLSYAQKQKIIKLIEESGCIWLQMTGGEPFMDKDFIRLYSFAHSLGLLITISTNGSLLGDEKVLKALRQHPPYRVTISCYGASPESYEKLTMKEGSFDNFILALEKLSRISIRIRLNIIITKYNEGEIDDMVKIAENFGFEYHIFYNIFPALDRDLSPIDFLARGSDSVRKRNEVAISDYIKCDAGNDSFHINCQGKMSICKVVRYPNINLLEEGISGFEKLVKISDELHNKYSECSDCEFRQCCTTCPFTLELYSNTSSVPASVCRKRNVSYIK